MAVDLERGSRRAARPPVDVLRPVPRWARPARVATLLITDTAILCGVAALATAIWAVGLLGQSFGLYLGLLPLLALFPLGFALAGLYPGFGLGAVEVFRRLTLQTSFVYLILAAGSFVLKVPPRYSRATFFIAWLGTVALLPVVRLLVLSLVHKARWWREPAIVIGHGPLMLRVLDSLESAHSLGYRPACVLQLAETGAGDPPPVPVIDGLEDAEKLAKRGFRVVLVVETAAVTDQLIEWLQLRFRHVILIPAAEHLPIEGVATRNLGSVVGLEFHNQLLRAGNRALKRALDLTLGTVLLVLALPLIGLAALAVRLTSGAPAFFHQEREGLGGRTIRVWKIRTMRGDAASRLERHLEENPRARREWETHLKLQDDPRVIPGVGWLLRRFSIDELPQLWSVVRGKMSLVGPRPFPNYHLERFPPAFRDLRRQVRPGITGLWQVAVRSTGGLREQERFDTYYIRNWSLWLDLYLLGRTGMAVLKARGAY